MRVWRKNKVKQVQVLLVEAEARVNRADRLIRLQKSLFSRKRTSPSIRPAVKEAKFDRMELEPTSEQRRRRQQQPAPNPTTTTMTRDQSSQAPTAAEEEQDLQDQILSSCENDEEFDDDDDNNNDKGARYRASPVPANRAQPSRDEQQTPSATTRQHRKNSKDMDTEEDAYEERRETQEELEPAPEFHRDNNPYRTVLWIVHPKARYARLSMLKRDILSINVPGCEALKLQIDPRLYSLQHASSEVKSTRFGPMLTVTLPKLRPRPSMPRLSRGFF
jgi:hypothetical protein